MNLFEITDLAKPGDLFHRQNDTQHIYMITPNQKLVLKTGRFDWEYTDYNIMNLEDQHASDWVLITRQSTNE